MAGKIERFLGRRMGKPRLESHLIKKRVTFLRKPTIFGRLFFGKNVLFNPEERGSLMRIWKIGLVMVLSLGLFGYGCDKDKESADDTSSEKAAEKEADGDAHPTEEQVKAFDCDKICKFQTECVKKYMKEPPHGTWEKGIEACKDGCEMLKSIYDPEKHGSTAKGLAGYAAGKCD